MTIDTYEDPVMRAEIERAFPHNAPRRRAARKAPGARETGKGGVHRTIVSLVRQAYPQARVAHLENESFGRLTQAQRGAKLADGMWVGAPDLITLWPGGVCVLLEVKREVGGDTTDRQDDCHAWLRRAGFHVAVVRSQDEAIAAFRAAGVIW